MKKISRTDAEKEIKEFFENIEDKSSRDIKKIKRLAMSHNIPLKGLRRKFCKKCYSPLKGKVRIKNKIKIIICEKCDYINKWKIKS